ncbi:MAG: G5 domain-containing protein [Oscillibacter sp.]
MKLETLSQTLHSFWKRSTTAICLLTALACVAAVSNEHANALYILTGADDAAIVLDETASVTDFSSQLVYLGTRSGGYEVSLVAGQTVSIRYEGATISTQAQAETISELLVRMHIAPGPLDMIAVDLSGPGTALTIASELTYYDQVVENVPFATVRKANPHLAQGVENVVQVGVNGVRTAIYEVIWSGGEELSRQFVEEVDSTAVDQIVEYGTSVATVSPTDRLANVVKNDDGSGTLVFQSGATMPFSKTKGMTATAYTAGHGGADTCTATGSRARVGAVAVDKKVIPLGTRMYIVSNDGRVVYGMAVAEDTGVRGNVVDLYYDTYRQCIEFGRRGCTVYFLD